MVISDDHIIIIEIKGGAFTYTNPANDFNSHINSIKDLLIKPAKQSERFINYLNSSNEVKLYNKDHDEIAIIKNEDYRVITAKAETLSDIGMDTE
ncbi:MAG: hypothetical protein JEY94_11405 [Melioribacteraceae bacterium]|nr:hypothetical protein [Melioribacteraceae bacterium]